MEEKIAQIIEDQFYIQSGVSVLHEEDVKKLKLRSIQRLNYLAHIGYQHEQQYEDYTKSKESAFAMKMLDKELFRKDIKSNLQESLKNLVDNSIMEIDLMNPDVQEVLRLAQLGELNEENFNNFKATL